MNLKSGPVWESFEALRVGYSGFLKGLKPGEVATLIVKGKSYRLLTAEDFQALEAQAQYVAQLKQAIEDVRLAVQAMEQAPSEATRALLSRLVDRLVALKENA